MNSGDSAARRLYTLLSELQGYWDSNHNLLTAWQEAFAAVDGDGEKRSISSIQISLGSLIADIQVDAQALDPNPPVAATMQYLNDWTRVCFGRGFDPGGTALVSVQRIPQHAIDGLLLIASLSEVNFNAKKIESDQLELLGRQAEELLKELRADTLLPAELRRKLVRAVLEVADSIRDYRIRGSANLERAGQVLVGYMATGEVAVDEPGVASAWSKVRRFVQYLVATLRFGQGFASLMNGEVSDAIEQIEGASDVFEAEIVDDQRE
ncbi:hypothetical protein [Saccharothrix australiensis]|uniref:Uncharacterized protein n=1 Tax=Saccharothrix australiensis TaxID=2072 RepID=A0A495VU77_9PSEU|nr:hypothetical protein [Saccharothrix australiensis]RKT52951.1 hypothetical protein C8E97_1492 [Saccharothrix australiensis]